MNLAFYMDSPTFVCDVCKKLFRYHFEVKGHLRYIHNIAVQEKLK